MTRVEKTWTFQNCNRFLKILEIKMHTLPIFLLNHRTTCKNFKTQSLTTLTTTNSVEFFLLSKWMPFRLHNKNIYFQWVLFAKTLIVENFWVFGTESTKVFCLWGAFCSMQIFSSQNFLCFLSDQLQHFPFFSFMHSYKHSFSIPFVWTSCQKIPMKNVT